MVWSSAWLRICIGPHWMSNTMGAASFWKAQHQILRTLCLFGSWKHSILLVKTRMDMKLPFWWVKATNSVWLNPIWYIFGCIPLPFIGRNMFPIIAITWESRSRRTTMRKPGINISAARRPKGAWVMLFEHVWAYVSHRGCETSRIWHRRVVFSKDAPGSVCVFDMGVSINGGSPKWMVYKGKSENPIKMDDLGVPPF